MWPAQRHRADRRDHRGSELHSMDRDQQRACQQRSGPVERAGPIGSGLGVDTQARAQYIAAGQSMRGAAAQTVGLVKLTPHRVMRELYQQFIAYARAYAERMPKYTPADNTWQVPRIAPRLLWERSAPPFPTVRGGAGALGAAFVAALGHRPRRQSR